MSDLISRSEAKKEFRKWLDSQQDYRTIDQVLDDVPTAYDVDKIVERLEERKEGYLNQYEKTFTASSRRAYESYDDAIDIVKEEGGLDV